MYLPRQRLRSRNNIHDHILTVLSCPDRIIQSAHTGGDNYGKSRRWMSDRSSTHHQIRSDGCSHPTGAIPDRHGYVRTAAGQSPVHCSPSDCAADVPAIPDIRFDLPHFTKELLRRPAGGVRFVRRPTTTRSSSFSMLPHSPQDRDPGRLPFPPQAPLPYKFRSALYADIPVVIAIDKYRTAS